MVSLVFMWLTSSTWWGIQYLQNSSRDMAQKKEMKVLDFA